MRGGTVRVVRRRVAALVLGLVAAAILGGCQYLLGYGPYPPEYPMPKAAATYKSGHATVTLDKQPAFELGELTDGGTLDPTFGASATFHNADGWYLRIMGASSGGNVYSVPAYMTLDRIVEKQHWTTLDSSRCVVTVTKADETGLAGTATCKGLRWSDALSNGFGSGGLQPPYISGEPAFDAEIIFEATPSDARVG